MKVAVVYVVVTHGKSTKDYCARFVSTFKAHPPLFSNDLILACNGGPVSNDLGLMFSGLGPVFYPRKNDAGYDLSAYMELAGGYCKDYDMMLCLGQSCYFHREGWLVRLVEAWNKHGPGMYGPFATNVIRAHLQTTAFCCSPSMFSKYPLPLFTRKDRYEFEHGAFAFWRRLAFEGIPVKLVTWDGEWNPREFRKPVNIMWRGDQSNLLFFCNHSDQYRDASPTRKANWSKSADRPFK